MRVIDFLLVVYLVVALLALTGVLLRNVATADGLFLGLPVGLAWVSGWALATFVVLWVYDAVRFAGSAESGEDRR